MIWNKGDIQHHKWEEEVGQEPNEKSIVVRHVLADIDASWINIECDVQVACDCHWDVASKCDSQEWREEHLLFQSCLFVVVRS